MSTEKLFSEIMSKMYAKNIMKKYTKVVTLGGKSSVGWWYGDDSVVQGFIGDDFDTREEAEAASDTCIQKNYIPNSENLLDTDQSEGKI